MILLTCFFISYILCNITRFLCKLVKRYIIDFLILITCFTFFEGTIQISHKTKINIQTNKEPGKIGKNIGIVEIKINIIEAKSICEDCKYEFKTENVYTLCPQCDSYKTSILQGKEMKVKSILVD